MKRLWMWVGPVSAGKSEGALRIIRRLQRQSSIKHADKKMVVCHIRPESSRRMEEPTGQSRTKTGMQYPCVYINSIELTVNELSKLEIEPDILWFDEIHFFEAGKAAGIVAEVIQQLRKNYMIIISGIGASTKLEPICLSMGTLLSVADKIYHEEADCDFCGRLSCASRSVYIGNGQEEKIKLGGEESYKPACVECWQKLRDSN